MDTPAVSPRLRPYDAIAREAGVAGDRAARMKAMADLLWDRLAATGVSWIGFYLKTPGRDEMLLGPRRDKPACSPIGLHGACGRCWSSRKSVIVTDVAKLGAGYIACDPRDKSEAVIPLFEQDGSCWGVLDADSYDVDAFTRADAEGLVRVLRASGLTSREPDGVEVI